MLYSVWAMHHCSRSNIFNTGLWYHNLLKTTFTHANSCINMQKQTKCKKQSKKQMRLRLLWHSPRYSWRLLAKSKQRYICRDAEENQNPFPQSILTDFSPAIFAVIASSCSHAIPFFSTVCLFINSLSITTESCGCTFFVDLCDSRVAAGAAVGSLMQLPINNQCPPLPERELHKACQPIKTCFIPCTALSLHKPVQLFKGWGSRGG